MVVGPLGAGEDVGQRFSHVVQVGDAVGAHVVDEPRRGELGGGHRRAGIQGHRPPRQHSVGMEQRHRQVADVVADQFEAGGQRRAGEQHHRVHDLDGFRVAAGPGGEDQHERVGGRDLAVWSQFALRGSGQALPVRAAHEQHPHARQLQPVEQVDVLGVGEQDLAVGARDVARQRGAAAGVVDAADDVPAEPGRGHCGEHVRGVAQQNTDVQRAIGIGDADQCGCLAGGLVEVLAPRPGLCAPFHRDPVGDLVVVAQFSQQLLNGFRHFIALPAGEQILACVNCRPARTRHRHTEPRPSAKINR